jgi:hypothetical protein
MIDEVPAFQVKKLEARLGFTASLTPRLLRLFAYIGAAAREVVPVGFPKDLPHEEHHQVDAALGGLLLVLAAAAIPVVRRLLRRPSFAPSARRTS